MIGLLLLALLAGAAPRTDSSDLFMGRGISRELASHRARQIRDVRYDLRLDVTALDRATGHVTVRFTRAAPGDVILDFRGASLAHARANGHDVAGLVANGAHVRVPAAALADGENVLDFDFGAPIAKAGTSIIRYHDVTDDSDYLYTLFVPADANALFPCFDQPDLKARVTFSLTAPRGWAVLANGAPAGSAPAGEATTFRFAQTEPISTYLIAFAAGPWTRITSRVSPRPITLWVRASRAKEVEGDTLIALNARALDWLESYFDRAYPFAKFDFLLAPAFPFGGMEHPGAVFYNEESFIFRERPTLVQRLGREATIFHEVAHQWFGDLVTMRWFDDLWLKEGFASYMAAVMQDAIDPQASAWKFFYLRNRPAAYQVDASLGTTPVWQSLANLDQAKSAYGAIVYNKAPGILKQLDHLVGDTAFRDGLRLYLHEHEYGNATWRDLLSAVGRAAHRDLAPWGAAYIQRAGMPVIEQQLVVKDGRLASLALVQHPAQPLSGHAPWPAKLDVVLGYREGHDVHIPVELRGTRTVVPVVGRPAPEWVYANAGDYGYALVMLDARTVRWLEAHIGTVDDALQRAMLWGSLWDLVRDARWAPAKFVDLALRELPRERDEQITTSVLAHLSRAMEAYLSPARRDSLLPLVERTLAAQMADDSLSYGLRKVYLDALIANAGTPATLAHLDALLDSTTAVGAPLGEPTRWAIVTRLIATRAPSAASRAAMEARRDSTSEGRRRHFAALAATPDQEVKRKYWSAFFSPDINEEWATASLRAFDTPEQSELTLPYVVPALDSLPWIQRNRRIFFLGAWLGAFMDGQTSPDATARVDRFLDEHRDLALDLRQKILQAADELQRTVKIRQTFGVTGAEGAR